MLPSPLGTMVQTLTIEILATGWYINGSDIKQNTAMFYGFLALSISTDSRNKVLGRLPREFGSVFPLNRSNIRLRPRSYARCKCKCNRKHRETRVNQGNANASARKGKFPILCACICTCVELVHTYFSLHLHFRLRSTCKPGLGQMQAQTQASEALRVRHLGIKS